MKLDVSSAEYQALTKVIHALNTPSFSSRFIECLQCVVKFDNAIILGYQDGKRPVYLYDSIQESRELLFQRYLTDSFVNDPFHIAIQHESKERIFRRKDVSLLSSENNNYRQDFYHQTGWLDELCLLVWLDERRRVVIYLGTTELSGFCNADYSALQMRFELVSSLCRQHWGNTPFRLPEIREDSVHIWQAIERTLSALGGELLTPREQEVASLVVQGLDSKEISVQLGVGIGTVKNHRKRIYAKLNVSSLSELFQIFLTQLIASDK